MSKPVLYQFAAAMWPKAALIAITEGGYKPEDYDVRSVNLAQGANYDPDYLSINENGTVPTLVVDNQKYTDTISIVKEILKRSPDAPSNDSGPDSELQNLIKSLHSPALDPNMTFLLPVDDDDRAQKTEGMLAILLRGRQEALKRFSQDAPARFASFLAEKQASTDALRDFYTGNPDQATRTAMYTKANDVWKAAGDFIRGDVTQALRKAPGKFLGGASRPGEADIQLITWLARTVTNAGAPPGSPSDVAIAAVQKKTGGQQIDPVVAAYWDSWITRPSFRSNRVF